MIALDQPGVVALASRFAVPESDQLVFARLPESVRNDVMRRLRIVSAVTEAVESGVSVAQACRSEAVVWRNYKGLSESRIRRLYYDFEREKSWRALINKAQAGPAFYKGSAVTLPQGLIEFYRGLCERNNRKNLPAWRELRRIWQTGHDSTGRRYDLIPGYTEWPKPEPATDLPRGWSSANLSRYVPTKFELTVSRIGITAASAHRPLVLSTRVGLRVGQYYMFDDMWHDFKVIIQGQRRAQRLLQFHAHDLFSACNFARGMKPITEEDGVQERLRGKVEMPFLLAHVFSTFGYRPDIGTVLILEHGSAALSELQEKLLFDLSGGLIRVERSGIVGCESIAGMYGGMGKGNFRFKASLEASHNLIHNETANTLLIPGQTGSNSRLNAPEELAGREKAANALIRAMHGLPPEVLTLLRLPFLEFHQALLIVNEIHERINRRTEHELEGWTEAGLVGTEFRLEHDAPWQAMTKLLAMPEAQRGAIEQWIDQPNMVRTRKLSPREVFDAGSRELRTLAPHAEAMLLRDGFAHRDPVTVRGGMIRFESRELSPEALRYEAVTTDGRLRDGEKFEPVLNPMDIDRLHLVDARGRYVGTVLRSQRVARSDVDAVKRAMGAAAKAEAELLAPVQARGMAVMRQRAEDARWNADVLAGKPVTAEEKERDRELRSNVRQYGEDAAEAILDCPQEDLVDRGEAVEAQAEQPIEDYLDSIT